jgi:multiple sugar transport system substrate-binding protein
MRIRHLLLAIVALAVAPISASRAQQTEIVIYHYQTDKRHEALKQVFRRFEAENADIKIVDIFKPDQTITSDVQAALAARRQVDIATIAGRNVYFMSRTTAAVPINQDAGKAAFLDNYLPQFLDVGRRGDQVFAMPYAFGTPMLYYNKDVFRKPASIPRRRRRHGTKSSAPPAASRRRPALRA